MRGSASRHATAVWAEEEHGSDSCMNAPGIRACAWAGNDPLMRRYHDEEWGVPVHDDRRLFEFLTLEGAQAGLSWATILRKRAAYRWAFDGFEPARVARFRASRVQDRKSVV